MNLECVRDFIHLLRSPYSPDFEFEKKDFRQVLWDRKSALFKNFFEPQESGLTFLDLIQFLSASFGENDRYLEINSSGDWTNFLAGILQDHPIASCIIQTSFDHELSFEDERILNLPELYLDNISFFQVDQDSDVRDILEILKTEEPEIENTIVLLPIVEDYRQHFLNLLTIAPFLGTSALLLTPGANYPWIRQGNQDFIHFHPQARTLLDLALKNRHLGDRLAGVQVIGIGEDWVEFYDSHIHFNPHFLAGLTAIPSGDRSASLALTTYGLHQQTVQQHLGEAISEHQQGDRDRAADLYQKILQQDLHQDLAWANLSTIAFERDDRDQALQFSYIAAQICPENDLHWRNLGLLYKRNRDLQQSIYLFRKALQINNQFPLNYLNLAKALEQANQFAEAAQILQAGREQFPLDFLLYVKQRLVKPLIYKSSDHVEQIHGEILDHLKQIFHDIQAEPDCLLKLNLNQINEIFEALDLAYFAYQGLDLVPIAKTIAEILTAILQVTQPDLLPYTLSPRLDLDRTREEAKPRATPQKIRVGYVGTCLRDHVIGYLSRGWIQYHDRSQFEIFCYSINAKHSPEDSIAFTFEQHSDRFYLFNHSDASILQQIIRDQIDILVFLDLNVGTSVTYYSFLRLAPIQCGFWGNPMTSGSSNLDYFLSSQLMESWSSQDHYTETLVYLPYLASCLIPEEVEIPTITADQLELSPDRIIYLFTQTLLKHLPQYDYIFPAIAEQVPNAQFIFLARPDEYLAQAFLERLEIAFAAQNLAMKQYCTLFPVMPKPQFYALQSFVNVALDSLGWSGGVTSLDAIACNLPLVTYPGDFMRGRHSYGILQRLGVTETIAHSEQEYIDIAIQLGVDRAWNEHIRQRIEQNKHRLYSDVAAVKGLENFYRSIYTGHLEKSP